MKLKKRKKLGRMLLGFLLVLSMILGLVPGMGLTAYATEPEIITVTWKNTDFSGQTHTKDGVTINSPGVVYNKGREIEVGKHNNEWTFTTTLGSFTNIEVTGGWTNTFPGGKAGWSGKKWTGDSSSVSAYGVVTDANGSQPWTITFTIKRVPVTGVKLNKTSTTLTAGSTETLTATVLPDDATNKTVTWSSENESVATVDANGVITAVAPGTANIIVTSNEDSDKTASCAVTVNPITYAVTYKVVNGTWENGKKEDDTKYVESGKKPKDIPTGMKAADGYTSGAWDKNPSETTITEATIFTYTFTAKQSATITKAPEAKTLTYNGQAQALVNAGEAEGGEMQYAIGKDVTTAPSDGWSASIPTATDAGTYYVWYMVKGDSNHNDSKPECVEVTINKKEETTEAPSSYKNEWVKGQWYDANGKTGYKPQGQWKKNSTGWWYVDEADWYPRDCWQKIDGKWYFFDDIGYMVTNAYAGSWSPYSEGYWWVGEDGAWDSSEPAVWRLTGTKWWFRDSTGWYAKGKSYNIGGNDYEFDADGWWIEK